MPAIVDPYAAEIAAFARAPRTSGTAAVLFLGSSSVRLWDKVDAFPSESAINHGFGGATVRDVLRHYRVLVEDCHPAAVIVYVGENDIATGRTPAETAADVLTLMTKLREDFPTARIAWLSLKPSPARWPLWREMTVVNAEVKAHAASAGAFDYIDIVPSLMGLDGRPDRTLFGPDGLHMSPLGYARWNRIVALYFAAGGQTAHVRPGPTGIR
ncbi:lipolytic enzyme [Sphingomonas nostoxanthinifaciens]|nr:lipolytic enzyme [Sphingomonas nostoxanthinifaciens]